MTQGFDVSTDVLHSAARTCRSIVDDLAGVSGTDLLPGRRSYGDASAITAADDFVGRYSYATQVLSQLVGAHADDLDASAQSYSEVDGLAVCVFAPER